MVVKSAAGAFRPGGFVSTLVSTFIDMQDNSPLHQPSELMISR
jgi:hypothetical protein